MRVIEKVLRLLQKEDPLLLDEQAICKMGFKNADTSAQTEKDWDFQDISDSWMRPWTFWINLIYTNAMRILIR